MKIEVLSCILHLKPFTVFPLPWMHTKLLLGHCSLHNPNHFNLSDLFSCRCHPWFQSHLVTCNFELKPHGVSQLYLSTSLFLCLANPWPHLFPQPAPRHSRAHLRSVHCQESLCDPLLFPEPHGFPDAIAVTSTLEVPVSFLVSASKTSSQKAETASDLYSVILCYKLGSFEGGEDSWQVIY